MSQIRDINGIAASVAASEQLFQTVEGRIIVGTNLKAVDFSSIGTISTHLSAIESYTYNILSCSNTTFSFTKDASMANKALGWSTFKGDFTCAVSDATKIATMTGHTATVTAGQIIGAEYWRAGARTILPIDDLTVSSGKITFNNMVGCFTATDTIHINLAKQDKAYQQSTDDSRSYTTNSIADRYSSGNSANSATYTYTAPLTTLRWPACLLFLHHNRQVWPLVKLYHLIRHFLRR